MKFVKSDLHRHIGGAIEPTTIYEIIKHQEPKTNRTLKQIKHAVQFQPKDKKTFKNFLRKFDILDTIKWDEWAINYALKQICWNIAKEQISYCELKFSIGRYVKDTGWTPEQVIKFIHQVIQTECDIWGIEIKLVLALKYEADRKQQKRFAKTIEDPDIIQIVDGLDLVGNEYYFDKDFYTSIFKQWKKAKKGLQAHVGESQSAINVRHAIEKLQVDRIAHGIKAWKNKDIISLAKERDICFDIAPTSNYYTGVVKDLKKHPIRKLYDQGIAVTIGTDDPSILNIDLDHEYAILQNDLGFSEPELIDIMRNSVKYAFNLNQ